MEKIENVLKDMQNAELTWTCAKDGHAMYEAVYKGEIIKMRLNDFPDEIAFTLFFGGQEIDLEDIPKTWHIASED
jgi:hypothetical protein